MDRVVPLLAFVVVLNRFLLIEGEVTTDVSIDVNICLESRDSNNFNPNYAEKSTLTDDDVECKTSETNGDGSSLLIGMPGFSKISNTDDTESTMSRLKGKVLHLAEMKGRASSMLMILIKEIKTMLESQASNILKTSNAVKMTLKIDIAEPKTLKTHSSKSDAFDSGNEPGTINSDDVDVGIKTIKLETYEAPTGSFPMSQEFELYVVCFILWAICAGVIGFLTYLQCY